MSNDRKDCVPKLIINNAFASSWAVANFGYDKATKTIGSFNNKPFTDESIIEFLG